MSLMWMLKIQTSCLRCYEFQQRLVNWLTANQYSLKKMLECLSVLLATALAVLQYGCYAKISYPPLGNVTTIVVTDQNQLLKKNTSPDLIAKVVRFVDGHGQGWYTPMAGAPVPKITLKFYDNAEYMGAFGVGANFYYAQRDGDFVAKSAADEEVLRFLRMIEVEKSRLSRKIGELDSSLPAPE